MRRFDDASRVSLVAAVLILLPSVALAASCNIVGLGQGWYTSFAIADDATVWSWGENSSGELGTGDYEYRNRPVPSIGLSDVASVSGGGYHILYLLNDGTVRATGSNGSGQLGDGTTSDSAVPVTVTGLTGVIEVAAGRNHSLALKGDGTVWGWGSNSYSALGDIGLPSTSVPVQIPGLVNVASVSCAGSTHSLAQLVDGTVWSWGDNREWQLGDGSTVPSSAIPVQVPFAVNPVSMRAGYEHSLALMSDNTLQAWGRGREGQLGDGLEAASNVPVAVNLLTNVIQYNASSYHSVALLADGTVWAWGGNDSGELGNGTSQWAPEPIAVFGLDQVVELASPGGEHNLARRADGTLWTWGRNEEGQLGLGHWANVYVPMMVDFDSVPAAQGNFLQAVRDIDDVVLTFAGATAPAWRLARDLDKLSIGATDLPPDVAVAFFRDPLAVPAAVDYYYYLRGLSGCSGVPGP